MENRNGEIGEQVGSGNTVVRSADRLPFIGGGAVHYEDSRDFMDLAGDIFEAIWTVEDIEEEAPTTRDILTSLAQVAAGYCGEGELTEAEAVEFMVESFYRQAEGRIAGAGGPPGHTRGVKGQIEPDAQVIE